jgi:WD40 repeat protein
MSECPRLELIADLLADRLGDADRAAFEEHVEQCTACQDALERLTGDADATRWQRLYAGLAPPGEAEVAGLGRLVGDLAPTGSAATVSPGLPREPADAGLPAVAGYEILGELGRGGMGVVYQARQKGLKRLVALKVILAGARAGARERARFRAEAEAVARLQHPNIVQIYEISEREGLLCLALEFIDGGSLAQRIAGSPQPPRAAAELVEVLSRAIHSAHKQNVVHRDLKPANVLLTAAGVPKIADFGLAKRLDDESAPTESGSILGTPSYMAPEQVQGRGHGIGPATDIYALGAILYELLSGRPPFKGASPMDTVLQVIHDEPVPPSRLQRHLPRDLETICLKCLARAPAGRYPSAAALADDLRRFLDGTPIQARPAGRFETAWKWARRHPAVAALLAAVVVVTALGFAGTLGQWYEAAGARDRAVEERRQKDEQWRAAEAARAEAENALYYSRIAQSELLWRAGDLIGAEQALDLCAPREGRRDWRGWEWRYLRGLYHRELLALPNAFGGLGGCAVFRPDGRQIAAVVGGHDAPRPADLRVWDAADGSLVAAWTVPPGVHRLAYSPDGSRIALAEVSGKVRIREAATGKELFARRLHNGHVAAVAFSPDGRRLATAGWDNLVKVIDAVTGEVLRTCTGHTKEVQGVAFCPDGRHLVSGGRDRDLLLWDADTGAKVRTYRGHHDHIYSVAVSPDGHRLASAGAGGSIKLWDTKTGQLLVSPTGHEAAVLGVAFSPDGRSLASGGGDRTVWVWDVASGARRMAFRGHSDLVSSVGFGPEGRRLLSFCPPQGMAKVWDLTRHPEHDTIGKTPEEAEAMTFRPDSRHLLTVARGGHLQTWDAVAGVLVRERQVAMTNELRTPAAVAAFDPTGRFLAGLAAEDPRVRDAPPVLKVWDVETAAELASLRGHTKVLWALRFSRDGRYLASAAWGPGTPTHEVKVWDAAGGRQLAGWTGDGRVWGLDFSPDGRLLAAAGPGRSVTVVDWRTREAVLDAAGGGQAVSVVFSPDGKQLATAELGGDAVKIWNVTGGDSRAVGRPRHTLRGFNQPFSLAYSPDGRPAGWPPRLAAVSRDAVKVWDAETGHEVLTLRGAPRRHWDPMFNPQVTFSPNGRRLAATSWDKTVSVWEAEERSAARARALRRAAAAAATPARPPPPGNGSGE